MKTKKLLAVLMTLALMISILQAPMDYVYAEEGQVVESDQIAPWAIEEVNMAMLYGLGEASMFQNFQQPVTREEVSNMGMNLYLKLMSENEPTEEEVRNTYNQIQNSVWLEVFEASQLATREEVGSYFYEVIKLSAPELDFSVKESFNIKDNSNISVDSLEALGYMSNKGIFKGRNNNSLDLTAYSTRQELLVLAQRTYEFVLHETNRASKGYFWKVSGGKSEVYLLGSIHIADMSIYPLHRSIETAFNQADYVVVEADITMMNEGIAYMQQKAIYTDGTTIDQYISAETYGLYTNKMEQYGFPPEVYNILKPWYSALLIQNLSLAEASYEATLGIDLYFLSRALDNKEILEIEGIPFQVDLFDSFSTQLQEEFLLGSLNGDTENEDGETIVVENLKGMLKSWKQGDVVELEKILETGEGSETENEFNNIVWVERNKNMTLKVLTYLEDETEKTYFIIAGAGHLVGETGVVQDLINRGYTLEQVTR